MRKFLIFLLILILLLFLYCYFFRKGGCCIPGRQPAEGSVTVKHWINWNLLFTPSSRGDSAQIILDFENYLNHYADSVNPSANLTFTLLYCPCDSLLTNIDATLVYGSGNPVPPPPTKPNPGPSGDYTLGNNFGMSIPDYADTNRVDTGLLKQDTSRITAVPFSTVYSRTLAVIDTGLDTLLFKMAYPNTVWSGNLLWQDPAKPTLFDVVIGETNNILMDQGTVKHGTAATWISLSQIRQLLPGRIPQIMSIRAFDDSERGSIYTVSCALSYAIQHHADFINASWGYFGQEDSVLKHYLLKADTQSIRIIAAAGNTPGHHDPTQVCNVKPNTFNLLDSLKKSDSLFYPACFAPNILNLVSVTQLNIVPQSIPQQIIPCFYQNYSSNYITVGALENPLLSKPCCTFHVPFLIHNIEGSSFATPVVTGILMSSVLDKAQNIKKYIIGHAQKIPNLPGTVLEPSSILNYTNNENYFTYYRIFQ
jgi:hypothetical protein